MRKRETYTVEIRRDQATGVAVTEHWYMDGKTHRVDGPSTITRDAATGNVIREGWSIKGNLNRADGPAVIIRNPVTGAITFSNWYKDGEKIAPPTRARTPSRSPKPYAGLSREPQGKSQGRPLRNNSDCYRPFIAILCDAVPVQLSGTLLLPIGSQRSSEESSGYPSPVGENSGQYGYLANAHPLHNCD